MAVRATDPADLGVTEARLTARRGLAVLARARGGMPAPDRRARRNAQPRGRSGLDQRLGPGLRGRRDRRREARGSDPRRRTPASARGAGGLEGRLCRGRQAADRLQPCLRGRPRAGQCRLGEPEGGGDGPAWTSPYPRVHGRGHHRPGRQPLGARSDGGRLERRLGGGARRPDDARGDRDGHGRITSHPLGDVRDLDDQADLRDDLVPGSPPAGAELRPCRPDGADDRRVRRAARADHPAERGAIGGRPPRQAAGAVAAALACRSGRRRGSRVRFRARGLPLARGRGRRGAGAGGGARRRRAPISASCSPSWRPGIAASPIVATSIALRFASGSRRERGRRTSAIDYWEAQIQRREDTDAWLDWFSEHGVDAVIEPTVPVVAWNAATGTTTGAPMRS